jgi:hypothetical protein
MLDTENRFCYLRAPSYRGQILYPTKIIEIL